MNNKYNEIMDLPHRFSETCPQMPMSVGAVLAHGCFEAVLCDGTLSISITDERLATDQDILISCCCESLHLCG